MTRGIHVGVVGVGRIGAFHARTLAGLEDVERLTVVDDDGERASHLAAALGAETRDSPEALLAAGVDALVVATSTPRTRRCSPSPRVRAFPPSARSRSPWSWT